jgi:hypothetical protein
LDGEINRAFQKEAQIMKERLGHPPEPSLTL